jgi:hypothetical protein
MVDKLLKIGNISEFESKVLARLERGRLLFGNKLQLAEIKVLNLIEDLKYNEDYFKTCEGCSNKFSIVELQEVDNSLYCDNCISENFYSCENCGDLVYNEDIYTLNEAGYCKECYFKVRQEVYHNHKIINPLIKKLNENIARFNLKEIEFKIGGNLFSIEIYGGKFYRLGSWGANSWVDIGNSEADLLKAIDYNLGTGRDKLTNIFLNKNTEIEL